eukprot:CAMPEP_0119498000 /NCGR_PEP_ID=MMETSP1344-20130328/20867_1 /TAXON_ID=236787 /ORGANISM="Florenciella parvula, Strain CCMP2471" /LENGTH=72 /DNA_ID=CAMNT_0007533833 /DNA_START=196 /DNA_END=411 /DNA_ORIENTATION=+
MTPSPFVSYCGNMPSYRAFSSKVKTQHSGVPAGRGCGYKPSKTGCGRDCPAVRLSSASVTDTPACAIEMSRI